MSMGWSLRKGAKRGQIEVHARSGSGHCQPPGRRPHVADANSRAARGISGTATAQPLQRQQQAGGEQDEQRGHGGNGGRDVLADAVEHLARQCGLVGTGQEQRDHHLVERGSKRKQRAGDHARRNHR